MHLLSRRGELGDRLLPGVDDLRGHFVPLPFEDPRLAVREEVPEVGRALRGISRIHEPSGAGDRILIEDEGRPLPDPVELAYEAAPALRRRDLLYIGGYLPELQGFGKLRPGEVFLPQ